MIAEERRVRAVLPSLAVDPFEARLKFVETDEHVAPGNHKADGPMQIICLRNHRADDVVFFRRCERYEQARARAAIDFAHDVRSVSFPAALMSGRFRLHEL